MVVARVVWRSCGPLALSRNSCDRLGSARLAAGGRIPSGFTQAASRQRPGWAPRDFYWCCQPGTGSQS
jgi:hypothetical protein